jgi:AraC-like DNA-binding protein
MLNINQILGNFTAIIQPIANQQDIHLSFENMDTPVLTELPLDEVLAPVQWLVLRLLYILPKAHALKLAVLQRHDAAENRWFLRIEMMTTDLFFNPNLIFRPDTNRFKMEHRNKNETIIFIEWAVSAPASLPIKLHQRLWEADEMSKCNENLMDSAHIHLTTVQRFQDYGSSTFVKDKLNATQSKKESLFLEQLQAVILKNLDNVDFHGEDLEQALALSKAQLFRNVKKLTGFSSANYIRHIRLHKASELLEMTQLSVSDIADKVGFKDLSYFSNCFMEEFRFSPSEWRKNHKNETSK